jgi:hypothetical protein
MNIQSEAERRYPNMKSPSGIIKRQIFEAGATYEQERSKVLREALEKIIALPGEWNDAKQIARKALGDFKYPECKDKTVQALNTYNNEQPK